MHKNFIQKHTPMVVLIVVCFLIIPNILEVFASKQTTTNQDTLKIQEPADRSLQIGKVVLDAGHGGYDDGSTSEDGILEKDINLQIVNRCANYLQEANVEVVFTRNSDEVIWSDDNVDDLLMRSQIANDASVDYFISFHMNFSEISGEIQGNEVWVNFDDEQAVVLANNINEQLVNYSYTENRGLKDENESPLSVVRFSKMPTVLVETGFISNPNDTAYLVSEEGIDTAAKAIANGIITTIQSKH